MYIYLFDINKKKIKRLLQVPVAVPQPVPVPVPVPKPYPVIQTKTIAVPVEKPVPVTVPVKVPVPVPAPYPVKVSQRDGFLSFSFNNSINQKNESNVQFDTFVALPNLSFSFFFWWMDFKSFKILFSGTSRSSVSSRSSQASSSRR